MYTTASYSPSKMIPAATNTLTQTPFTNYDKKKNVLFVKGNSTAQSVLPLYEGIGELINEHFTVSHELNLYLYLNEINTITVKALFDIFRNLKSHHDNGKVIKVTWFFDFEDQAMVENAYDFSDLFQLKFVIVPV